MDDIVSPPHQPKTPLPRAAKKTFTAAGSQRADHAGSGGHRAGARADCPVNAMPVTAQYIVRAGVLAFAFGVGAAVANTPGVAFAETTDSCASSSSSGSRRRLRVRHQNPQKVRHQRVRRRQQIRRPQSLAPRQIRSGVVQSSGAQANATTSPSDASTADPRSGVVQSSGGAQASATTSPSDASTADPRSGVVEIGWYAHQLDTVEQRKHRIGCGDAYPNQGACCARHSATRRAVGRRGAH